MFEDWKKKKLQNDKPIQSAKELIDSLEPSYLAKNIKTCFEIELIQKESDNSPKENYEEIISKILTGKFWDVDNPEFKIIANKELGEKAISIWELLKPYYRQNALIPETFDATWINLSTEISQDLSENKEKYIITRSSSWSRVGNEILDPEEKCIQIYAPIEKTLEISNNESKTDNVEPIKTKSIYFRKLSLVELYEEIIEKLTPKQFNKYAKGKDGLEHILILYVTKRAKNQDPIAANLLFESYKEKARYEAYRFVKNILNDKDVEFKPSSDFGKENINYVSDIFLRMLISGDDPDAFFKLINSLDSGNNLYHIFTRNLGKKIRRQIKKTKIRIVQTVESIKDIRKAISELELKSSRIMIGISEKDFESVTKIINEAAKEIECQKMNNSPNAYRSLINTEDMNDNEKKIYQIFIEVDDFIKQNYIPKINNYCLALIGLSNPFFWVSTGDWFNNKLFDAAKNNNFSNWLFADSGKKPGAFKAMMMLWRNSSEFKSKGKFKGELFKTDEQDNDFEKIASNESPNPMEEKDLIENLISRYVNLTSHSDTKRKRNSKILQLYFKRIFNKDKIDFDDLGNIFNLSRRQIINICMGFKIFAKKEF